jgi:acyl carrier protein
MFRFSLLVVALGCTMGCTYGSSANGSKTEQQPVDSQDKKSKNDVEPVVRGVVAERLRVKPQSIDMNKPIVDELGVVQIVMTLEERFKIEIPDKIIDQHGHAKLGEPACKLSPFQLVAIVEESRKLAAKK